MKSIFITYNRSLTAMVAQLLDKHNIRGYTRWEDVRGRGTHTGEPHEGTHTWPELNNALITIVENDKVEPLINSLKELDNQYNQHGLRAFVWNIEAVL